MPWRTRYAAGKRRLGPQKGGVGCDCFAVCRPDRREAAGPPLPGGVNARRGAGYGEGGARGRETAKRSRWGKGPRADAKRPRRAARRRRLCTNSRCATSMWYNGAMRKHIEPSRYVKRVASLTRAESSSEAWVIMLSCGHGLRQSGGQVLNELYLPCLECFIEAAEMIDHHVIPGHTSSPEGPHGACLN